MAVAEAHHHHRRGGGGQQGQPVGHDAGDEPQGGGERHGLPHDERGDIGQQREQRRDEHERRGIMPAVEGNLRIVMHRALHRRLRPPVPRFRRLAVQRHPSGRPDVREIGAEWPAEEIERAVRGGEQRDEHQHGRAKRYLRDHRDATPVEPASGGDRLNHRHLHDADPLMFRGRLPCLPLASGGAALYVRGATANLARRNRV